MVLALRVGLRQVSVGQLDAQMNRTTVVPSATARSARCGFLTASLSCGIGSVGDVPGPDEGHGRWIEARELREHNGTDHVHMP